MGTQYPSQTTATYNANPPADDGSVSAANKVFWSTIKSKLGDPTYNLVVAINSALLAALDTSATTQSTAYTTTASDHLKPINVTGTTTIKLGDSATMGVGYMPIVNNTGAGVVTVSLLTASDTLDGTVNGTIALQPKQSAIYCQNQAGTGYTTIASNWIPNVVRNNISIDVALNNSSYVDGPTVSQGTAGTWLVMSSITLTDTSVNNIDVKLWDGTTVIDSVRTSVSTANGYTVVALSGAISSPAGNIKISCKASTNTAILVANVSSNGKDSLLTATRIS